MHVNTLYATIEADVHFTRDEINKLMELSKSHYDGVCKDASFPHKGFLYGWQTEMGVNSGLDKTVKWRTLDTLAKIAEMENGGALFPGGKPILGDLGLKIRDIIRQMNDHAGLFEKFQESLK